MHKRLISSLLTAAAVLALCGTALAQAPAAAQSPPAAAAPPAADDVTVVDALVVKAVRPGPAFWKVSLGRSTVWLMGVPNALPKGVTWKHDELKAHLRNAHVLIMGTGGYTINIIDILRLLFTMNEAKATQPLDKLLPPDLMARYEAARKSLNAPDRATDLKPGFAAIFLSASFQRALKMDDSQPEKAISREAFLRVHTDRVGRTAIIDLVKIFEAMPPAVAQACVEDAVRQVEAGKDRELQAAHGWTTGDLRVAISAERGWEHCIADDPQITALTNQNIADVTAAILDALKKPGRSVAVVDLRPLLAQNGILVRLMAQPGVKITPPDAPGLEDEIGAEAAEPELNPEPAPSPVPTVPAT